MITLYDRYYKSNQKPKKKKRVKKKVLLLALCIGLIPFNTKHAQCLIPETNITIKRGQLVVLDRWSSPDEVGFMWLDELGTFDDLPSRESDDAQEDHGIVGEERADVPSAGTEYGISIAYKDASLEAESKDRAVWLEVTAVGEFLAVDTLGLAGAIEEYVVDTHDNVINHTTGGDDVGKPEKGCN